MTRTITAALLALTLASPSIALAGPPPASPLTRSGVVTVDGPIAAAASRHATTQTPAMQRQGDPAAVPSRQRGVTQKVLSGIAGGVGGFFLGGYLGSKLEPACHCDDPGLKGFLIGAPVGAATGAIAGALFL